MYICKLSIDLYKCVTPDIAADEVIITDKQIEHIKERHPNDFERYFKYAEQIITDPDYILESKMPQTAFILKRISENGKNYQLILRLKTSDNPEEFKNSVITFLKVEDKKWRKYLRNKKIIYRKPLDKPE
ncbi:MAG: PBECR2 nuclease fold domain-containing protein [Ruminococcus sp.]|nr:PBECR2 nuclease fold domain-containing protein [Ruminococcus sp.]MCM1382003.1 PBECR2 nuclease fold domain-containing protein [Muribaculaceae bacterium]MCM1478351.1 PBECR2 nuclease fold domain-containing protein [Muribaculaceae bacterium]